MRTGDAWAFGNDRLAVGWAWKRRDWMTRNGTERWPRGWGVRGSPRAASGPGAGGGLYRALNINEQARPAWRSALDGEG